MSRRPRTAQLTQGRGARARATLHRFEMQTKGQEGRIVGHRWALSWEAWRAGFRSRYRAALGAITTRIGPPRQGSGSRPPEPWPAILLAIRWTRLDGDRDPAVLWGRLAVGNLRAEWGAFGPARAGIDNRRAGCIRPHMGLRLHRDGFAGVAASHLCERMGRSRRRGRLAKCVMRSATTFFMASRAA